MDKWKMLRAKEHDLLETEEITSKEARKTTQIKEQYQEHFHEAQRFLEECCYMFHKNDQSYFFESTMDEFSHESRKVLVQLENSEEVIHRQKKKIQQDLEDITYEKRRVILEEQEERK
ncbi:DUF3958 family protein [Carnobacterium gallinarum]|uniref:DUF3958 family protein n=1 Tax=Carnobacterium gallinarum TaxID=2749 RepID=UPI00054F6A50|nr:DUF3958 family protein [Carnobacterium gallinarum]